MRYLVLSVLGLAACSQPAAEIAQSGPEHLLQSLCGNSYQGKVVSTDAVDEDWRAEVLTLGPVRCPSVNRFEMPLAVGANTSRTWVITGTGDSLELRHQHVLEDGSPDPVTEYGGPIQGFPKVVGAIAKMDFPADKKTIQNFMDNGLEASVTNVWTLEISPRQTLSYELNRENRHFRAEFDLKTPL